MPTVVAPALAEVLDEIVGFFDASRTCVVQEKTRHLVRDERAHDQATSPRPRFRISRWHIAASGAGATLDDAIRRGTAPSVLWFAMLRQAGYTVEDQRRALYHHLIPS